MFVVGNSIYHIRRNLFVNDCINILSVFMQNIEHEKLMFDRLQEEQAAILRQQQQMLSHSAMVFFSVGKCLG